MTKWNNKRMSFGLIGIVLILCIGSAALLYSLRDISMQNKRLKLAMSQMPVRDPHLVTLEMRPGGHLSFGVGPGLPDGVVFAMLRKIQSDLSTNLVIQLNADRSCLSSGIPVFVSAVFSNVAIRELKVCVSNLPVSRSPDIVY